MTGVVKQVNADAKTLLVKHDEIPGYMTAMTMPFKVRNATNFAALGVGDKIVFQLSVTEEESWISNIRRIGHEPSSATPIPIVSAPKTNSSSSAHPLRDFAFTNELGSHLETVGKHLLGIEQVPRFV